MKENMLGIDVGGTKCAIIYGIKENGFFIQQQIGVIGYAARNRMNIFK